jgi:hypothetical protein
MSTELVQRILEAKRLARLEAGIPDFDIPPEDRKPTEWQLRWIKHLSDAAYQAGLKAGREHERKLIGVLVENCKDFDEFAAAIRSLHGGAAETARSGEDEVQ